MSRRQLLILSDPAPGREQEYQDWYTHTHLPDVLTIPGFTAAQRFSTADTGSGPSLPAFAAIYEFEAEDVDAVFAQLAERFGNDQQTQELLDFSTLRTLVLTPICERQQSS